MQLTQVIRKPPETTDFKLNEQHDGLKVLSQLKTAIFPNMLIFFIRVIHNWPAKSDLLIRYSHQSKRSLQRPPTPQAILV